MSHEGSFKAVVFAGSLFTVMTTTNAAIPPTALQGRWAGDRMQLVIDAQGGRIEGDCASGTITGPVVVAADGRFTSHGSFETYHPGPQRADEAGAVASVNFAGELRNGTLTLTITPAGAGPAKVYTMQSGARVKLVRCR